MYNFQDLNTINGQIFPILSMLEFQLLCINKHTHALAMPQEFVFF